MPGQKFGPAWFPGLVAVGLAICGALLVFKSARHHREWVELPAWLHSPRARNGVAALVAGLVAYILLAERAGFHLTGIVLVTLWVRVLGASWRTAVLVGIVGTIAIHLAFYKLLRVPLPWGVLERWAF